MNDADSGICDMRDACRVMGVELHSTDHFMSCALDWLAAHGKFTLRHEGEGCFCVTTSEYAAPDDTLADTLVSAVVTQSHVSEMDAWEEASDEALDATEQGGAR